MSEKELMIIFKNIMHQNKDFLEDVDKFEDHKDIDENNY